MGVGSVESLFVLANYHDLTREYDLYGKQAGIIGTKPALVINRCTAFCLLGLWHEIQVKTELYIL